MAQSCYIRLITLVDDHGRYEADPVLLKSEAFPLREDIRSEQVSKLLKELHYAQLLNLYTTDGKALLQLTNWTERKRSESRYAAPTKAQLADNSPQRAVSCAPPESESESESKPPPAAGKCAQDVAIEPPAGFPASEEKAWGVCEMLCIPREFVLKTWNTAMARGGEDAKGRPVTSFTHYVKSCWSFEQDRKARDKDKHGKHANPNKQGVDRNAGTFNAGKASQYRNMGKVG